jgi:beta-lactamase class A
VKRAGFLSAAGAALLAPRAASSTSLNARIRAIAHAMPGSIGIYARTMTLGPPLVAYNASEHFPTASIIKVLIMTTAYAMEEASPGTLETKITFHSRNLIGGSDFMDQADDGQRFTVAQLVVPMIQVSDNTAANLLIAHFGIKTINAVGARAGLARTHLARQFLDYTAITHHNKNVSTPEDMARLLYLIERGARERTATVASPGYCRKMISIMLGQTDHDGIPKALPRGTPVANKTGQIVGTLNDIAIIEPFGDSPFVLSIMTKGIYYPDAYAAIHAMTRATYAAAGKSFD